MRLASILFLFSSICQAAGSAGGKTNLGLQVGLGQPGVVSPVFIIGLEGNLGVGDRLAVGPFYYKYSSSLSIASDGSDAVAAATASTDTTTTGTSTPTTSGTGITTTVLSDVATTFMGGQASFGFPTLLQGFSAGMRIGKATVAKTLTVTQGTTSVVLNEESSGIVLAPRILLDRPVSASVSIGGEMSYWYGLSSSLPRGIVILIPVRYLF